MAVSLLDTVEVNKLFIKNVLSISFIVCQCLISYNIEYICIMLEKSGNSVQPREC